VHQSQLRVWVKSFGDDPQHAGQGQMKPEQLESAQARGHKAQSRTSILKKAAVDSTDERKVMEHHDGLRRITMAQMNGRPGLSSHQKHELGLRKSLLILSWQKQTSFWHEITSSSQKTFLFAE
jgi:hypothetical protein